MNDIATINIFDTCKRLAKELGFDLRAAKCFIIRKKARAVRGSFDSFLLDDWENIVSSPDLNFIWGWLQGYQLHRQEAKMKADEKRRKERKKAAKKKAAKKVTKKKKKVSKRGK